MIWDRPLMLSSFNDFLVCLNIDEPHIENMIEVFEWLTGETFLVLDMSTVQVAQWSVLDWCVR